VSANIRAIQNRRMTDSNEYFKNLLEIGFMVEMGSKIWRKKGFHVTWDWFSDFKTTE
jgi:hypothetical protein